MGAGGRSGVRGVRVRHASSAVHMSPRLRMLIRSFSVIVTPRTELYALMIVHAPAANVRVDVTVIMRSLKPSCQGLD